MDEKRVFRATKSIYIVFAVIFGIIVLLLTLLFAIVSLSNDRGFLIALVGFGLLMGFFLPLYALICLIIWSCKITIDAEILRYQHGFFRREIPLAEISEAKFEPKSSGARAIHIFTSSSEKPELKMNAGVLNPKQLDEVLDVLNKK